jgi:HSP20 family protein
MPSLLQPVVRDLDGRARTVGTPAHPALMRMDAWRDGDTFVAELDLPGINSDSLDVTVESGVLTVRAERREPGDGARTWVSAERPHGVFVRQLFLNGQLDIDKIGADYTNGVLRLTIPMHQTAKPRKIAVVSGRTHASRHRLTPAWLRRWLPHASRGRLTVRG